MDDRPEDDPPNCDNCTWKDHVEFTEVNQELWELFFSCHRWQRYKGADGKYHNVIERHTWPNAGGFLDQDDLHINAFNIIKNVIRQNG